MRRVSPTPLSFTPNILQTLHYAKSSPPIIFTQNFRNKKIWEFSF